MSDLIPQPLTAAAFAPFGEVLEDKTAKAVKDINENTTKRFHDLADIALLDNNATVGVSLFRGTPRPRPIRIAMMEHHPLASQAFLPAQEKEWLVVVAPNDSDNGKPDMKNIVCFQATGKQGVNYRPGVWHHPLLVFSQQDFWVVDRIPPSGEDASVNLREYWCAEEEVRLIAV